MILSETNPSYEFTPEDVSAQIEVQKDTSWDKDNYNGINVKNALIKAGASEQAAKLMLSKVMDKVAEDITTRFKQALERAKTAATSVRMQRAGNQD